ncbi:hypothetical protein Q604_UNBC01365G0001, partial [human gut metagenome]
MSSRFWSEDRRQALALTLRMTQRSGASE